MESLLLITNCQAGSTDNEALQQALQVLEDHFDVEVAVTGDLVELAAVLSQRGSRDVAVMGGDGSLHAVVDILHSTGVLGTPTLGTPTLGTPTLGILPLGTGNDFARGLGIPLEPAEAAQVIVNGNRCDVDLLIDDAGGVVVNAVHAGIGADAGQAARPWKRFGRIGYVAGALIAGFTTTGDNIRVVADGLLLASGRRRVLQVGVGNGPQIGGGVELTPDADPTDGLADVLVSFAVGPFERLLYALHLRRGTHEERHDVSITQASTVTLTGPAFWCDADGELSGPLTKRSWTIRPQALSVFFSPGPEPAHGVHCGQARWIGPSMQHRFYACLNAQNQVSARRSVVIPRTETPNEPLGHTCQ